MDDRSSSPRAALHRVLTPLLLVLAAAATACSTPTPPPASPIPATYRIGPPDSLDISVLPDPIITRSVVVRPDGKISFDLIGDVVATDRTASEIAADIEKRIARYKRDARVTVSVAAALANRVSMFGEVRRQAVIPLANETRIAEALAQSGGTTFLAWNSRVRVIRTDGETTQVMRVNFSAIKRGNLSTNMLLEGGDIVVVPPTILGSIGYFMQQVLFPFNQVLGASLSGYNFANTF